MQTEPVRNDRKNTREAVDRSHPHPIRALIVDDSPLDRQGLRRYCARQPDIEVIGECGNGREAIEAIRSSTPSLVFLDIQMGDMDGFRVVEAIGEERMPFIVFTTGFDEHALQAFEIDAVDYLLKPYDEERFAGAMSRIRARMAEGASARLEAHLSRTLANVAGEILQKANRQPARIVVEQDDHLVFLDPEDIDCVEAQRNYVRVRAGPDDYLLRCSMKRVEELLGPAGFLRIQRSVIVNSARIRGLERWFHGEYKIILLNGMTFVSGRRYRKRILRYVRNQAS
ncbi:MAG: LytR/AlgR family response regulator transcription factor [Gammaproteobacteria bacterium]